MFPVASSGRICCFRCFAGARARRLSGYPDVCAITDAPLLCGAGRDGAGPAEPDGLHHDLEIGKRSTTSSMSTTSLTLFGLRGYVFYGCISTRCLYLVDRSWYLDVPIVGNFLFSMLRTLHLPLSLSPIGAPPPEASPPCIASSAARFWPNCCDPLDRYPAARIDHLTKGYGLIWTIRFHLNTTAHDG